jgi:hypothetical protein
MPNTFKSKMATGTGTAASTDMLVYSVPASTTTVIVGLTFANIGASQITASAKLGTSQGTAHLIKNIPIPVGSSFEFMGGNKIVMETGNTLVVQSDTANSLDTVLSIMEIT